MKLHKQQYYFQTSEVLPTIKDADYHGYILVWDDITWRTVGYYQAIDYSHWMQIPKGPDVADQDF